MNGTLTTVAPDSVRYRMIQRLLTLACRLVAPDYFRRHRDVAFRDGAWHQGPGDRDNIDLRRAFGEGLRTLAPSYSFCSHCGWPWKFVSSHTVEHDDGGGFFVVCDFCYDYLKQYGKRDLFVRYCMDLCRDWSDPDRDENWFDQQIERDWPSRPACGFTVWMSDED